MTLHTRLACFALLVTWSASHVTASWCRSEDIAPFSSALEYVELTEGTEFIGEGELQTLITDAFKRASCDDQDLGLKTCNNCLEAAHVFQLLDVASSPGLNEENLAKAMTLIVHYMYQLPEICAKTDSTDWKTMTYDDLVEEFKEAFHDHDDDHDHDHDHGFSWSQLEDLVMAVNGTYKPGERDGAGDIVDPDPDVCSHVSSFRSGDVYQRSAMEHPEEGVTDSELASMNSVLLFYLLRGDCIREDLRVDSEVPEPDDFIFALFEEFADPDSCLIKEEGFSQLLAHLGIHADDGHDHDHDHDHDHLQNHARPDLYDHGIPDPAKMCMSEDQLAAVFGFDLSVGLSREQLEEMSPMLVQQAAQGCTYTQEEEEGPRPDAGAECLSSFHIH